MRNIKQLVRDWENEAFGYGYGNGEDHILPALKTFFETLEENRNHDYQRVEEKLDKLAAWLMINVLCKMDIIEYGSSARYGWLTPQGERLRDFLATKSSDDLYKLVMYEVECEEDYFVCYRDACNCGPGGYDPKAICQNPFWHRKVN